MFLLHINHNKVMHVKSHLKHTIGHKMKIKMKGEATQSIIKIYS